MQPTANSPESDVRLPRAIRERMQRIRLLEQQQAAPGEESQTPQAEAVSHQPAIEPPAPAPATPAPTPSGPMPVLTGNPRESDINYWMQRTAVAHGIIEKINRENTEARNALIAQVNDLQQQLINLQKSHPAPQQKIDLSQFFTPEQIEQYGPEQCETLANVAIRAAREETQAAIAAEIRPMRERQELDAKEKETSAQRKFLLDLAAIVPNYEQIDAQDGWKLWLSQEDPDTGIVRQQLLNTHVAAKRADRVGLMFTAYLQGQGAPVTPPVSPANRAGPPAAPPVQQAPALGYPSQAEIREFYKRASLGKVSDKERAEFEARLQLAPKAAQAA